MKNKYKILLGLMIASSIFLTACTQTFTPWGQVDTETEEVPSDEE